MELSQAYSNYPNEDPSEVLIGAPSSSGGGGSGPAPSPLLFAGGLLFIFWGGGDTGLGVGPRDLAGCLRLCLFG